jgi:hypothetical protein
MDTNAPEAMHESHTQQQQQQQHHGDHHQDGQQELQDQELQQELQDGQEQDEEIPPSVYQPLLTDLMNNAFNEIATDFKNTNENLANEYRQQIADIQSQAFDLQRRTAETSNRLLRVSAFFHNPEEIIPVENIEDVYSNRAEIGDDMQEE